MTRERVLTAIMAGLVSLLGWLLLQPGCCIDHVASPESLAVANLRTINTALSTFASLHNGRHATMQQLISAGLLDSKFEFSVPGYSFAIMTAGSNYTVTATPMSRDAGAYGYYVGPDGAVRYQKQTSANCTPCFPAGQAGEIVQ